MTTPQRTSADQTLFELGFAHGAKAQQNGRDEFDLAYAGVQPYMTGFNAGWDDAAHFPGVIPGCLPEGTVTSLGTVERSTLTAYRMADGNFVPFGKVHGTPEAATPLVIFR